MSGFFSRVSRYARPALSEQRENRLTEIFAGVLEHVPGLALRLSRNWLVEEPRDVAARPAWAPARAALDEDGAELRSLRTQRFTRSGWFVDLELRFGHPLASPADDVVVWVEVKHGASPHEHQLSNYLTDVADLGVRASAVVLLAPRSSYPFEPEPPPEVAQLTWQWTARACRGWPCGTDVERFLIDEFLVYLKEESLMDPEVVTPFHLAVLAESDRAHEAVARACEVASGYISGSWERGNINESRGRPLWGVGYWEAYFVAPRGQQAADWGGASFVWTLKHNDAVFPESRGGVPVFMAGVSTPRAKPIVSGPDGAAWLAKLHAAHGFVPIEDERQRVARYAYPEELLVGRDLQRQGRRLGEWVATTFEALYEAGPPPGIA